MLVDLREHYFECLSAFQATLKANWRPDLHCALVTLAQLCSVPGFGVSRQQCAPVALAHLCSAPCSGASMPQCALTLAHLCSAPGYDAMKPMCAMCRFDSVPPISAST